MRVNLSGVEPWGSAESLPPGDYIMKVCEVEETTSKNLNPMLVVDMEVAAGDFKGAEHRDWITVTEKSLGRVVGILTAFGIKIPDGEFNLDGKLLVGKRAVVTLREEIYDGHAKVRVKAYAAAPDATDVPADLPAAQPAAAAAADTSDLPF